jgi:hypothetical protein
LSEEPAHAPNITSVARGDGMPLAAAWISDAIRRQEGAR